MGRILLTLLLTAVSSSQPQAKGASRFSDKRRDVPKVFFRITLTEAWYQNRPTLAGKPRLIVFYAAVKDIFEYQIGVNPCRCVG
jgi:hypothetical protein